MGGGSRAGRGDRYHGDGIIDGGSPVPVSVRGLVGDGAQEVRGPVRGRHVPRLDLDKYRGYVFVSSGDGRTAGTPPERLPFED